MLSRILKLNRFYSSHHSALQKQGKDELYKFSEIATIVLQILCQYLVLQAVTLHKQRIKHVYYQNTSS